MGRSSSTAVDGVDDRSVVTWWVVGMGEVEPVELSKRSPEPEFVIAGISLDIACGLVDVWVSAGRARARRCIGIARKACVVGRLRRSRKITTTR